MKLERQEHKVERKIRSTINLDAFNFGRYLNLGRYSDFGRTSKLERQGIYERAFD